MRILLLTQVVPYPPDSGPKIKTYNVLRYLAQQHEVHLVSFVRTEAERNAAEWLRGWCADVVTVPLRRSVGRDVAFLARSLARRRPFLIERDDLRAMRLAVEETVARVAPDAVHADQLSMGQFAVDLPVRLRILDEHNAVWTIVQRAAKHEGRGVRRLLAELEWRKLRHYEADLCRRFDQVTVVSLEDRVALEQAAGERLPTHVIPIAIDPGELPFRPRGEKARDVVSVATMFYPPNVEGIQWFSEGVFPLVRNAAPETQFLVVGSRPPDRIKQLMTPSSGIVVMDYVADLDPVLQRGGVLVVPVHSGSGMRVKILESFARGIPVVTTSIGVEGIDARHGEHLLIADEPAAFAEAVVCLLRDRVVAARLAAAGRRLVEKHYDWRTALSVLDEVYTLGPRQTPSGLRAIG
jgi:glycosyltransferase involved in cell wall biosynthesis